MGKDHLGELHFAEMKDHESGTTEAVDAFMESWRKRSHAIACGTPEPANLLPKKRFRGKSYQFDMILDNMITWTAGVPGLSFFQV